MKNEQEIRRHRDDLLKSLAKPCGCAGGDHELACVVGGKMMLAVAKTLSWILDENPGHDPIVDELHRRNEPGRRVH